MKNAIHSFSFIYLTLLASSIAVAQAGTLNDSPWKGEAGLGFSKNSGNVDAERLNYKLKIVHNMSMNEATFKLKGNYAEANDETIKENYTISLLDEYSLNETSAVYGKLTYLENKFKGYESLWKLGGGYLYKWLDQDDKSLKTRIGYQARIAEFTTGEDDTQDFLLVGFRGKLPVMENISFATEFNYEVNFSEHEDYESDLELSLIFKVNKTINIEMDYKIEYNNMPTAGIENTDKAITTKLVYKF